MERILASVRTGAWLTRERIRLWALALLGASVLGVVYVAATSNGLTDYQGRPLGTDFSSFYAAGTSVLEGRPEAPFDPSLQHARQQAIFGTGTPFYVWTYPPFFLVPAAAFALMPYPVALGLWQALTLILYLVAIRAILSGTDATPPRREPISHPADDRLWLLIALAYPAVFINIGHGQNGLLNAALLAGGLVLLERRPFAAGVLFGLLAYKPQFGLMIPVALVAAGQWRAIIGAAATLIALVLATTALFGADIWPAFLRSTEFSRQVMLEAGDAGWHKLQSLFAWARMWGGSVTLAYVIQGVVIVFVAAALAALWHGRARYALKGSALAVATLLASPHSFDYDLMILAPAIAYLALDGFKYGFGPYEKTAMAALWFVPLIARTVAQHTALPLAVPLTLVVFALTLARAFPDLGSFHSRFFAHRS